MANAGIDKIADRRRPLSFVHLTGLTDQREPRLFDLCPNLGAYRNIVE